MMMMMISFLSFWHTISPKSQVLRAVWNVIVIQYMLVHAIVYSPLYQKGVIQKLRHAIRRITHSVTQCDKGEGVGRHTRHLYSVCYHVVLLCCCAWSFGLFCQCRCWPVRPCSSYGHVSFSHQHIWPSLITVGQQLNVRQQFVQETWLLEKCHVDNGREWSLFFCIVLYSLCTLEGLKPLWHNFLRG